MNDLKALVLRRGLFFTLKCLAIHFPHFNLVPFFKLEQIYSLSIINIYGKI